MYILTEYSVSGQTLHQPPWFCSCTGSVSNIETPAHNASRIWTDCGRLWLQCSLKVCLNPQHFAWHSKCSDNTLLLILGKAYDMHKRGERCYNIMYRKHEWKRPHGRPRHVWDDNSKMDLKKKKHGVRIRSGFIEFRVKSCETFMFHKSQRISWLINNLL